MEKEINNIDKKNFGAKKLTLIILGAIVAVLMVALISLSYLFSSGIKNIEIKEKASGEKVLVIEHGRGIYDTFNYRIEEVMRIDLGESILEDSELFGKYRVKITFSDIAFAENFKYGRTVKELEDVPDNSEAKYNIITAMHGDSASVIYIGSDKPINLVKKGSAEVDSIRGKIEIPFEN